MGILSKLNVTAVLLFALAVSVTTITTARAEDVLDQEAGYTLSVPRGWDRIPDGSLSRAKSLMLGPGAAADVPNFVAGFEPAEHKTYFDYRYVLVQLQPYA